MGTFSDCFALIWSRNLFKFYIHFFFLSHECHLNCLLTKEEKFIKKQSQKLSLLLTFIDSLTTENLRKTADGQL